MTHFVLRTFKSVISIILFVFDLKTNQNNYAMPQTGCKCCVVGVVNGLVTRNEQEDGAICQIRNI